MSEVSFILDIAYNLLIGTLYGAVAWAVSRRRVSTKTELANLAFQNWWAILSLFSFTAIVTAFIGRFELWSYPAYLAYLVFVIVLIVYAIFSLMHYFVFLFTGSRAATGAVVAFYLAFTVFLLYSIFLAEPQGLMYDAGVVALDNARDLSNHPITLWVGILFLGPPVLGALAYASLYFKVDDRTQKFRIITVGGSIFLWMATALGGSIGGASADGSTWYLVVSRIVAVLATLANYFAFKPPAWLRDRLNLRAVDDPPEQDLSS